MLVGHIMVLGEEMLSEGILFQDVLIDRAGCPRTDGIYLFGPPLPEPITTTVWTGIAIEWMAKLDYIRWLRNHL